MRGHTLGLFPSPLRGGVRGGGSAVADHRSDKLRPPSPALPLKGGGSAAKSVAILMAGTSTIATTSPRAATAAPLLVVDDIIKNFETPDGVLTAVDHMSFDVAPGEFLAVIGPSGCGKSTLFNIIGGLLDGYDGRVTVAGETVQGPHPSIGMMFQEESTFPWRTVIDNVAFPLEIAGHAEGASASSAPSISSIWSACAASSAAIRPNCPAACASASRSRARSPPSRRSC